MSGSGSGSGLASPTKATASSPTLLRHHPPSRSIPEVTTPVVAGAHNSHRHHKTHSSHHHHITGHISNSLHRRDRSRDDRQGPMVAPQSGPAVPPPQQQQSLRGSLEVPRSDGSGNISSDQSRRESTLPPGAGVGAAAGGAPSLSIEEAFRLEKARAEARTTGLKKSLDDLSTFSNSTTRRLDETYYSVLQQLTLLQNTILALKDLATVSTETSDGFIAESQTVVAEASAQLDRFGDFSAQQARVQALQDRVHGGRERIAGLSHRVDAVRRRVERWELADRQWQERTRRRLKMAWGVAMAVGLAVLLLYVGAKAWGLDVSQVAAGGQQDAVVANKMQLERKVVSPGGEAEVEQVLNLSREERTEAARVGDEVLRTLDEL